MLFLFFFHATATTEIYTLSLHDALPISVRTARRRHHLTQAQLAGLSGTGLRFISELERGKPSISLHKLVPVLDRKSTRLNSSHPSISYAVFCLKKKNKNI